MLLMINNVNLNKFCDFVIVLMYNIFVICNYIVYMYYYYFIKINLVCYVRKQLYKINIYIIVFIFNVILN